MTSLLVAFVLAGFADDPVKADGSAMRRYEAFVKEYDAALKAWDERYSPGGKPTPEDRAIDRYRDWPGWSFLPRAAAMAGGKADDPGTVAAFFWVGEQVRSVGLNDDAMYSTFERLLGRLTPDDLARFDGGERLRDGFRYVFMRPSPATEAFLEKAMADGPDRSARGRAGLALAKLLKAKVMMRRDPWYERPDLTPFQKYLASRRDRRLDDYFRGCDPSKTRAAAVAALRRTIAEFADVVYTPRLKGEPITVGDVAEMELNELDNLQVGMVAPDTRGVDVDGKPLRLSDSRGKVVLLSFWGSWCGPCMEMVPHERALIERLKGKPFAILGVNSDDTPEKARAVMAREKMTWPSWFDGGRVGGPIAGAWNAGPWPTLYVLDAEGKIRFKGHGPTGLDAAVDAAFAPIPAAGR
ncbi:Thiol-disulfide oxidoreductase ResA [Aquisphaera giovannonii]|uniref:Thiol-disulfide oxidoreductase ResA n=1 Tax=Aquisphaera giovannonii TaxID=406548 RepID=A0A5B9VVR4_9BACT|nr:TlpA disulfide reductase family protein [Aquisphaera giovannonii]QEH32328.1 Thiol-disulfide oxidoreductase ResA [Aquisphaera giovannonii]